MADLLVATLCMHLLGQFHSAMQETTSRTTADSRPASVLVNANGGKAQRKRRAVLEDPSATEYQRRIPVVVLAPAA